MDPPSEEEIPMPLIRSDPEPEMPQDAPPVPPAANANSKANATPPSLTDDDNVKKDEPPVKQDDKPPPKETPTVDATSTPTDKSSPSSNGNGNENKNEIQMPLSPKQRSISFADLRSYESKRRTIYLKKLKSSSIYWKAFRDTLSKAYEEIERAEILIRGSAVANKTYADYLTAAADDRLDYSGLPMTDEKKARRYRKEKGKKYTSLGAGSLLWGKAANNGGSGKDITGNVSDNNNQEKKRLEAARTNSNTSVNTSSVDESFTEADNFGLPEDSLLTSFVHSHEQMAEKFQENYTFIQNTLLVKATGLRKELEAEVHIMSMLGDVTIFELEKAEDDVQKAWGELILLFFFFNI